HPCLCLAAKALRSQSSEALEDELLRVARIVAVAGAMQDIKGLPRLRNRREQRVVAASALALGVIADRCSLDPSRLRAQHRPVEVEREPRRRCGDRAIPNHIAQQTTKPIDAGRVELAESARHRRDVRDLVQSEHPEHQRVVSVVVDVAQPPPAEEHMHDEEQDELAAAVGRRGLEVSQALPKASRKLRSQQEALQHDEPAERGEIVICETNLGNRVACGGDLLARRSHESLTPSWTGLSSRSNDAMFRLFHFHRVVRGLHRECGWSAPLRFMRQPHSPMGTLGFVAGSVVVNATSAWTSKMWNKGSTASSSAELHREVATDDQRRAAAVEARLPVVRRAAPAFPEA